MNTGAIVSFFLKRKWILLALLVVTPTGFLFKFYSGPIHQWFNNYGAGIMYEIFWCLLIFFFYARKKASAKIAIGVFLATSILEVLQLWHPLFLQQIRSTFFGSALLGTSFVWWDFPCYVLGCVIGWVCMQEIARTF